METDAIYGEKIHSRWVIAFFAVIFGFILVLLYLILTDIYHMQLLFWIDFGICPGVDSDNH